MERCLENIWVTKPRAQDLRMQISCLLIGLVAGVTLIPGANMQMQFYIIYFIPMLTMMVNLPPAVMCWPYFFLFPVESVP